MAPVEYDPPEHGPLRALLNPLLAPQRMLALDTKVREYACGYISKFKDRGECELMDEFAFKFPIAVFLELMGLPEEDVDQLLIWEMGLLHEPEYSKIVQATRAVRDYLVEKLEDRRLNPRDDFLSMAANAKIDGRPVTLDEQIGIAFNLYTGGLDTVSTNIGLHIRHLAENQEHQAYLREHPEQIPLATEELLRAYAAVSTFRICVNETEVAGVRVMPGDRVVMNTTLACRDEQKYENPHEVRLDRGPQHEAFGFGPHRCVGMHLARRELHCALEEFLKAIPNFRSRQVRRLSRHWDRSSSRKRYLWSGPSPEPEARVFSVARKARAEATRHGRRTSPSAAKYPATTAAVMICDRPCPAEGFR